jgi:hypothetical protein
MAILYQDETVTVCGPSGWEIMRDEPHGEERWCFHCRKRREFRFIVGRDPDFMNDYYGPVPSVECSECHTSDGDMFPGGYRMWGDD